MFVLPPRQLRHLLPSRQARDPRLLRQKPRPVHTILRNSQLRGLKLIPEALHGFCLPLLLQLHRLPT